PGARCFGAEARPVEMAVPQREGDADRAARVTRGRLNPDLIEHLLATDASVADTVERHAAGQTQIRQAGFAPGEARHLEHHLLGDLLNGPREIHLALREPALGLACRTVEQRLEPPAGHR